MDDVENERTTKIIIMNVGIQNGIIWKRNETDASAVSPRQHFQYYY
jgi:hypothetical protein